MSLSNPDVVIVGSGIAGTTLAYLLTKWGRRVTVLEVGPKYEHPHSKQYEDEIVHLYRDPKYVVPRDLRRLEVTGNYLDSERLAYEQIMVQGGMATRWSAWTPRLGVDDFRTQSAFGYGVDWPFAYAELEPYYCRAEAHLGISGTDDDNPFAPPRSKKHPLPPFELGYAEHLLADRLKGKGIHLHSAPQARTRSAYDGRPGCANFGVCGVCPIGARYSPGHHLAQAAATGLLTIETDAAVRRIVTGPDGRARGVFYYADNKRGTEQPGRAVVIAAGAIESARLTLLTAAEGGTAARINESGQAGQNLLFNHIWTASGELDERLLIGRAGPPVAQTQQFANPKDRRKHGGMKVDVMNAFMYMGRDVYGRGGNAWESGPSTVNAWWEDAAAVRNEVGFNTNGLRVGLHTESVPTPQKSVALGTATDRFGDRFAKVHHESSAFDEEAKAWSLSVGKDILEKAGAHGVVGHGGEFGSGHHHLGTCRMGADPRTSVVDPFGRSHGIPNLYFAGGSIFPTCPAMNPTLTIVALAIRTAERVHASLG